MPNRLIEINTGIDEDVLKLGMLALANAAHRFMDKAKASDARKQIRKELDEFERESGAVWTDEGYQIPEK